MEELTEKEIIEILNNYEIEIYKAKNTDEIKKIVRKLYSDMRIDDIDFSDFIYDVVITRLNSDFKIDLEKNSNTNYENVMLENY